MIDTIKHIIKHGINSIKSEYNYSKTLSHLLQSDDLIKLLDDKYKDTKDIEIKLIINDYKKYGFNIYGLYRGGRDSRIINRVLRDNDGWPYIIFYGKRMYFPKDYQFKKENGYEYVDDIMYEQGEGSPHLYTRNTSVVPHGVIVDAGVCEGNFALRYIDRAKKIYLIESDSRWWQALEKTFHPYRNKTVFSHKYLGGHDSAKIITLDSLVQEHIDFLKMDIEGSEKEALLGGKKILKESDGELAICSYHCKGDEDNIRCILNSFGYTTSASKGYMFYVYDKEILDTLDFRRGVVYGYKNIK